MSLKYYGIVETLEYLINLLNNDTPFTYVRFGDGDLIAMYDESVDQTIGKNNQTYVTKEVQDKLIASYNFESDNYLVATVMRDNHKRNTKPNVDSQKLPDLKNHNLLFSSISIQECFLDHPEKFTEFVTALKKSRTLFVCWYIDDYLSEFYGDITHYIEVPKTNSTVEAKKVFHNILSLDESTYDKIILSCGQLSRMLSKDLHQSLPNKMIIDVGSLSDMLIINKPTFNKINIRGHIIKNKSKIISLVKKYSNAQ